MAFPVLYTAILLKSSRGLKSDDARRSEQELLIAHVVVTPTRQEYRLRAANLSPLASKRVDAVRPIFHDETDDGMSAIHDTAMGPVVCRKLEVPRLIALRGADLLLLKPVQICLQVVEPESTSN